MLGNSNAIACNANASAKSSMSSICNAVAIDMSNYV
jgi:hypothetical protein